MHPMLWLRGLIFTLLAPGVRGFVLPPAIDPSARRLGGFWNVGWVPIAAGTLIYGLCLVRFLLRGGTPAIFFSRRLRSFIGEEPEVLVSSGAYRFSRNPMYAGVLMVVSGQALLRASFALVCYACALFVFFHLIVVLAEEPHLRAARGQSYEAYCRAVPRWLGLPKKY